MTTLTARMTAALEEYGTWQEPLFEDLHRHPELSMREERTRGIVAVVSGSSAHPAHRHRGCGERGVRAAGAGRVTWTGRW